MGINILVGIAPLHINISLEAECMFVTNIQRYAIHDGGGIRTTVFFKGCPLGCLWCHNPETQGFAGEGFKRYSPDELARIVLRDQIFYENSGGVTISGGEPLAQDMKYMQKFLQILKKRDTHIACDTCGDVPWESFEAVLPYVDLFLYDIKLATGELHRKYTGQDNVRIISNLERLAKLAPYPQVWLRIPVIGGVNDGCEMAEIIALAKRVAPGSNVSLLPYHNMGTHKWEQIYKPVQDFSTPSSARMMQILEDFKQVGFNVEIGG